MTFVKDLFRRRVPQVVAIYFGAAWGLLEFVDFISQRFALSPHLIDLALIVPLLLLPSVILVTYFHGAPGQDEWVTAEKIGIPANLVVAGIFLVFFFQGKDLGAATTTVTVTDEDGVATERVVPKSEFRERLAVFFFDAEPADSTARWIQYGLPIAVVMDLIQDDFLDLSMPVNFSERLREAGLQDMVDVPLSLERELAEEQHRNHFVTGSVRTVDGVVEATVSLYETQRGRLVEERTYSGSDVLDLADQISVNLKEDLRIPQMGREGIQDLPVSEILTGSPEAYRLSTEFIIASQIERDFARGVSLLEQAVAVDPTYADAQHTLATLYLYTNQAELMAEPMQAAMDHIYRLPERLRFVVKSNYYFLVRQDMDKALASLVMWAELFPDDILAYQAQLQIQMVQDDKEGALESLNKILELDPGQRDVLLQIGDLHEAMGNLAAAEESFQKYAGEFPDDHEVLARLAALARRSGNLDRARELFDRALIMDPSDIGLLVGIGSVHLAAGEFERARGQFDEALDLASTPDNRAQVYSAIESYHVSRGQIDSAIVVMEQRLAEASTFQPPILVAQYRLGGVGRYAEAGRVEEAFRVLEEARSELTAPIDQMVPLGELRIHMVLENADEIEATIPRVEAFIDLLRYEMLRPEVVSAQGLVHELRGEHTEAIEKYEEEHRLKPADFTILTDLGRCHRKLGQFDQAVEYISEALLNSPFGPRTNYEMALTYEAMGRMDDAREHLNRSLEVWAEADPEYRWARRAREAAERIGG